MIFRRNLARLTRQTARRRIADSPLHREHGNHRTRHSTAENGTAQARTLEEEEPPTKRARASSTTAGQPADNPRPPAVAGPSPKRLPLSAGGRAFSIAAHKAADDAPDAATPGNGTRPTTHQPHTSPLTPGSCKKTPPLPSTLTPPLYYTPNLTPENPQTHP
ncbi:hypothetical protein HPB48_025118 [Haemaphysalis longicornis]|uniref:Uncharacterized protein n=1 Tax=Haemaphysalis longicornis TaxID=44386 RepID=A0A9J6H8X4_HAELO|nr:hypothetical protein HPB48_025118 [Haemaphysalis longicornis]